MPTPSDIIDGRYRLTRLLGEGGYGSVYAAEELSENTVLGAAGGEPLVLRQVALKLLNTQRAVDKRFLSEVRALCKLNHPSIVTVYGYGRETQPYVAMELVDGQSLAEWIGDRAKANINQTLRWLIGVADALSHAHARGVVHRDLKPHNVLITDDGWPKVVDFGLSWLVDPAAEQSQKVGTPGYLAPEVIEEGGQVADHRVDIYGLGATIFACFAGCSPFRSQTMVGTLKRHLAGDYAFPDDFPLALRPLVSRCLETDPIDRPRTAADVAEALRRLAVSSARVSSSSADDSAGQTALTEWQTLPDRVDVRDARVSDLERFDHPQRGAGLKFRLGLGDASPAHRRAHSLMRARPSHRRGACSTCSSRRGRTPR